MTHGISPAQARGVVIALPIARDPVAEARLVAVAGRVSALVFEAEDGGGPLMAFVDGVRLDGALVSTRLALRSGGLRQVVLVGLAPDGLRGRAVALARGGRVVAAIDPDWLQPPDAEIAALLEDLDEDGALRLLRLLLTTGASLFRDGGPEFAVLARRLLAGLGVRALEPVAVCATGTDSRIVTWRVAADFDASRLGDLVALTSGRPRRLARPPVHLQVGAKAALLHVELPRRLPAGCALVATGGTPLALAAPGPAALGDTAAFLAARDAGTVRFAHRLIEARMDRDPVAAAVANELRHADAPAPTLGVRHLSATPAGVVFALGLADPYGLVAAIRLSRATHSVDVPVAGRLEGYAVLPRENRIDDRCELALVYHSGRRLSLHEAALGRFDGTPPAGFGDVAALAAARADVERPTGATRVECFGAAPAPRLAILAPLSRDLDFLRARAALVSAERRRRQVEIVCWSDDPELAPAARSAMAHAAAAWGVPHRLVLLPRGASVAVGLREALGSTTAPRLLVLEANVLPAAPGWIERSLRGRGAARLVDHDGAPLDVSGAALALDREALAGAALRLPTPNAIALAGARRLGATFVAYGPSPRLAIECAADALALKPSFSLGCEESGA